MEPKLSFLLQCCQHQNIVEKSFKSHSFQNSNTTLSRESDGNDTSFVPEDLQDELGEANDMSVDELLKPPEPEEQEREREEEIRFRKQVVEIERNSQISQMKKAQIDAEAEQLRKSTQDFKSQMEENNKARRQFDGSLKQEDIKEILNAEFLNEVLKSSRHQDFHSGSRKYEGLFKRNLAHILSDEKADEVISQLKKKFKLSLGKHANNYIAHAIANHLYYIRAIY